MIRYSSDFNNMYFVEYFRKACKYQNRKCLPQSNPIRPISVVTTCMNRLEDIRRTLPKNISDNKDYPAEFVLLDYGSEDGLSDWIESEMRSEIESGKLVYYRTDQEHFRPNHSRNVSFRLASHNLITNVDADNYTNHGFLARLNELDSCDKVIILPESFLDHNSKRLNLRGRFAVHKRSIYDLGGFDEDLDEGYSHDDVSFVFRAILSGFNIARFEDEYLTGRIDTTNQNRTKLMRNISFEKYKHVNARLTAERLGRCEITANRSRYWGMATVTKNFSETVTLKPSS